MPSNAPDWGEPPWRIDVRPVAAPLPPHCDVAIVGGGFTGLSAAYHLARRGARVALLEAATLGAGASGRTGGIVLEGTAAGALDGVERCLDALVEVVANAGIACDLALPGCRELEHRAWPGGGPPSWRDGDTWLAVAGTVPGGSIDPGALVSGLARAAIDAGASLHEQTAARAIEPGSPVRVVTANGIVHAGRVVVALNAYTASVLRLPVRLDAALTLAVCTAPLAPAALDALGVADGVPFYTLDLPYLWGRTLRDGRLVLGAGLVTAGDTPVGGVGLGDPEASAAFDRLAARIAGFHPTLADVELGTRWGGPIAFTRARAPLLGPLPGAPAVLVTGGCAGHGIALGVRTGQLLAAAIADTAPLPAWGALDR